MLRTTLSLILAGTIAVLSTGCGGNKPAKAPTETAPLPKPPTAAGGGGDGGAAPGSSGTAQ